MQDLNNLIPANSGWVLGQATGINDAGQIVGLDSTGNRSFRLDPYDPDNHAYGLCLLYDPNKAAKSGSTIPVKLQLCTPGGANLSSSSISLHATAIVKISSANPNGVPDSGSVSPDNDFRFEPSSGNGGAYTFNLSTSGLTPGTYSLSFKVSSDLPAYSTLFQVR